MSDPAKDVQERFTPLLREWGVRLHSDQDRKLGVFLDELEFWNKRINLTGLSSRQRIVDELLVDSLLPAPFLPDQGTLLDVGSGGGFPAIPIKICKPRLRCRLIEPNAKKTHFLKQVIRLAGLGNIEVIQGRMEEQEGVLFPEGYDVITSRAFVPLAGYLTLCGPLLSPGGRMVAFLGDQSESAIQESAKLIDMHRLFPFKRISYRLPGKGRKREILILKKET
ncbi:MAG TPA: 16S rRNA (guanine(527)-N(7))-methyltransferase RsmG [Desulfobacteraceae bacterium]|nr:16S rRNA (guanine(527)-N(7))-methyltransferase RsmG [Desulfobacteraceae bacterium]